MNALASTVLDVLISYLNSRLLAHGTIFRKKVKLMPTKKKLKSYHSIDIKDYKIYVYKLRMEMKRNDSSYLLATKLSVYHHFHIFVKRRMDGDFVS